MASIYRDVRSSLLVEEPVCFDAEYNKAMGMEIMFLLQNSDVNQIRVLTENINHSITKLPQEKVSQGASIEWSIRTRFCFDEEERKLTRLLIQNSPGFPRTYFYIFTFAHEFLNFLHMKKERIEEISICPRSSPHFNPYLHEKLKCWRHMEAATC